MKNDLAIFEEYKIRRIYDEETETWFFSVIDIVQALIQQPNYQVARKYWNKLKERLKKEGSESVTNCHRLKLEGLYRRDRLQIKAKKLVHHLKR
jgi:DNA-damage-inducible protein D